MGNTLNNTIVHVFLNKRLSFEKKPHELSYRSNMKNFFCVVLILVRCCQTMSMTYAGSILVIDLESMVNSYFPVLSQLLTY